MTEIVPVNIKSCYKKNGQYVNLPSRMAVCVPEFKDAIQAIAAEVNALGGDFRLSDLFRSYDMQLQAHLDYKNGKKTAYSPPPGGSFHEAGRAFDVDLAGLRPLGGGNTYLRVFWGIAAKYGVVPIIGEPNPQRSEAWHFECRGEFQRIRDSLGYSQAVKAAILDIGADVDDFKDDEAAWVQAQLTAAGWNIGSIDGLLGKKTKAAIRDCKFRFAKSTYDRYASHSPEWESIDPWLLEFLSTTVKKIV